MTRKLKDELLSTGDEHNRLKERIEQTVNDELKDTPLIVSSTYTGESSEEIKVKLEMDGDEVIDLIEESDDSEGLSVSFMSSNMLIIKPEDKTEGNVNRG